jgi:hypothetical protein
MSVAAKSTGLVLFCAVWLWACRPFNADLLKEQAQKKPSSPGTEMPLGDAAAARDAGDAAALPTGFSGFGGSMLGTGGSGSVGSACKPNPNWLDGPCPVICPETCNGEDDDCDGTIDEDLQDACKLDHALATCNRGHCAIVGCVERYRDCDHDPATGCESAPSDVNNCGSCGNRCSFPHGVAACVDDQCVRSACEPLFSDCDPNANDCETAANTAQNCAGCGKTCSDGDVANATASCELGSCGIGECFNNHGDCNDMSADGCEQTLDTTDHCGACNKPCDFSGSIDDCSTGTCLAQSCEPGFDDCDGNPANGCESLGDSVHCGACNKICDTTLTNVTSASCDNQQCATSCATGFGDCDNDTSTGCESPITTLMRCSDCSTACAATNAVMNCDTGSCSFVRCDDGFGDCNNDVALDGCETALDQDTHCGACDTNCVGSGKPICSGGSCSDVTCPTDTADCNKDGLPCEVNLKTDASHCGSCSNACAFTSGTTPHAGAGLSCAAGRCKAGCDALYADCNNDYRDGCETPLTTSSNCGQCGMGCSIANASATCTTGACRVSQCAADWSDCDMDGKSCEVQLGTTQNCTGCGIACSLPNAQASCVGTAGSHSCAIASCMQSYFKDCDAKPANGCEIDIRSDVKNCGSCGHDCTKDGHVASATCSNGVCGYTCASGFGNCTSAAGCETPLNTNSDCRACGMGCLVMNGTGDCSSGTCMLASCNTGYNNCDSDASNCESLATNTNCGACGVPCAVANGTPTCATQTCQVMMCNAGWDDCDASPANGCERNVTAPGSGGGQGPCLPDTMGCTRQAYNGQDYFFCTTVRTWSDARTHCAQQLLGDLAHINDAAENTFVQSHLTVASWIGGSDTATEGTWRWANDSSVFFMGGNSVGYGNWSSGEPNDSGGNEDCAEAYTNGLWNDDTCSTAHGFVCEVQKDLCPMDPNKINPGQCGCGTLDTDTDSDGTADCNDGCPMDANKTAPGICGCGKGDGDGDGDGVPDCNDGCPMDPGKTAAGACGCGIVDTDGDGDGTPDCHDACPQDPTRSAAPCGLDYTPTNFNQNAINFGVTPTTNLNCNATTTIDTSGSVTLTNWCGTAPTPIVQSQSGGPDLVILALQGLTIAQTTTLRVVGNRPLVFAVRGDVTINGTIDARASGSTPGAGGNVSCSAGNGANGGSDSRSNEGAGGGAGGAFGSVGARGGSGDNGSAGGGASTTEGGSSLAPLRGGCRGGSGGNGSGTGGAGGGGGGAFQISSGGSISVAGSAVISTSGGGGVAASARRDGGGGGGSGGALLLEAHVVTVSSGAWVTANGGGGASGYPNTSSGASAAGGDGSPNSSAQASGASGSNSAGDGGKGAAGSPLNNAGNGADGQCDGGAILCLFAGTHGAGGGGGGGGVGRIRLHGTQSCGVSGANFSPALGAQNCP